MITTDNRREKKEGGRERGSFGNYLNPQYITMHTPQRPTGNILKRKDNNQNKQTVQDCPRSRYIHTQAVPAN